MIRLNRSLYAVLKPVDFSVPQDYASFYCFNNQLTHKPVTATIIFLTLTVSLVRNSDLCAKPSEKPDIVRIASNSVLTRDGLQGWSNIVIVASPKVTSGDVNKVSNMVLRYASMFTTVLTADVDKTPQGDRLRRIGIGLAVADGPDFRFVSTRTDQNDAKNENRLGVIATAVVQAAEKSLDQITVSLRHETAIVIDSPAVVFVAGKHQKLTARHLIWVHPKTGNVSSAVWFVREGEVPHVVDAQGVLLPANFRETRRLHVDAGEFLFGIPGENAFAMESLPSGIAFEMTGSVEQAAAKPKLTLDDLSVIAQHLSEVARNR